MKYFGIRYLASCEMLNQAEHRVYLGLNRDYLLTLNTFDTYLKSLKAF